MAIIKCPPPLPPTAEYKMLPGLPCLYILVVYSYHSISMPLIHKTLWLVKDAVVVVVGVCVGGGSKYYGHYKMTPPPPTAEYKMLPR